MISTSPVPGTQQGRLQKHQLLGPLLPCPALTATLPSLSCKDVADAPGPEGTLGGPVNPELGVKGCRRRLKWKAPSRRLRLEQQSGLDL